VPTLDRQGLRDEFNMAEPVEAEVVNDDNTNEIDEFELEWDEETADANVLRKNIENANDILDKIKTEIEGGNFSARMVEVAGQIINSITTASKVLIDDTNYNKYLDIRKALALLKKKEVEIKQIKSGNITNNNLFIGSREELLRIMKDKNEPDSENESEPNPEN
jgi:hypothetical protein